MARSSRERSGRLLLLVLATGFVAACVTPAAPQMTTAPPSRDVPASSAATSPAPGATAVASPTTFSNTALGYRIDLPAGYRPSSCESWVDPGTDPIGIDFFTPLSERDELELNIGDIPPAERASDFTVSAYRNGEGRSALEWARLQPLNQGATIEAITLSGHEAARIVAAEGSRAVSYAIRANGRIYAFVVDIRREGRDSDQFLQAIAADMQSIPPGPIPTPASKPPREAAQELANLLAKAFREGDAAGVMVRTRGCTLGMYAVVEPAGPNDTCCILNRSLFGFDQAFRPALASGAVKVVVDPTIHSVGAGGDERFFVVSQWTENGKTRQVDLLFDQRGGQWYWSGAIHHFQRVDGSVCYDRMWAGDYQGPPC